MKIFKLIIFSLGVVFVSFFGLLILGNPTRSEYEEFATKELSNYLQEEGCEEISSQELSLKAPCQSLLSIFIDAHKIELK